MNRPPVSERCSRVRICCAFVDRRLGQQHDELLAAVARHLVGRAQRLADDRGQRLQRLVAGAVAELVVEALEVVDVEQADRQRAAVALERARARSRRPASGRAGWRSASAGRSRPRRTGGASRPRARSRAASGRSPCCALPAGAPASAAPAPARCGSRRPSRAPRRSGSRASRPSRSRRHSGRRCRGSGRSASRARRARLSMLVDQRLERVARPLALAAQLALALARVAQQCR